MSTMSAVVLQRVGPPEALQIRNLTISVLTPGQVLIQIASFGLKWSEVRVRVGAAEVSSGSAITAALTQPACTAWCASGDAGQRIGHSRLCPIEDIPRGLRVVNGIRKLTPSRRWAQAVNAMRAAL